MDNPETLETPGTQNTGAIKNGQSRDNGNIGHTRNRTNTKPQGQSRMDNQETMATFCLLIVHS
jgi:hypothetical protein